MKYPKKAKFGLREFQRQLLSLRNEVERGKSMNSMTVRQIILFLVQFTHDESFDQLTDFIEEKEYL